MGVGIIYRVRGKESEGWVFFLKGVFEEGKVYEIVVRGYEGS